MLYNQSFLFDFGAIKENIPTFVCKKKTLNESSEKNSTPVFNTT